MQSRCPSNWTAKVLLIKNHEEVNGVDVCVGVYEFTAEIKLTANFNTSNMDWCVDCMTEALGKTSITTV